MENIKGKELYELLENGTVVLSDDKKTLINKTTKEVLGRQVDFKDGVGYFHAIGDEDNSVRGKVCLTYEWSDKLKVNVCVVWK